MSTSQQWKPVRRIKNKIKFFGKVDSYSHLHFMRAIDYFNQENHDRLILDFTNVKSAFPNGMVPIISGLDPIREKGIEILLSLPKQKDASRLFIYTNWAHLISPQNFKEEITTHNRHLIAKRFTNSDEQQNVVNEFIDVIMRNMDVSRDVIAGLEWSINEITDNVLNHSRSNNGGIVQVSTYPKNHSVSFSIADSGVGILNTLKEAIPTLNTDFEALGEAVKAGVTRNNDIGQGNGLAGTLRIATMSGGSFSITSGKGLMHVFKESSNKRIRKDYEVFQGTLVNADVKTDTSFTINEALGFEGYSDSTPVDIIERNYENEDGAISMNVANESTGFGNRGAGRQLRQKIKNLLNSNPDVPVMIDWNGVPLISSSFADEFLGKLFLEMGAMSFGARIRNAGMEALIRSLLDKAISQRLTQASDEL